MLTPRDDLLRSDKLREYAEKERDDFLRKRKRWVKLKGKRIPLFYASEAGACSRRIWYAMSGDKPRPNDEFSTLLLPDGERHEDSMIHWLEVMGHNPADRQKEFRKLLKSKVGSYAVVGHIDGTLTTQSGAEGVGQVKYLLECKGLSTHTMRRKDPTEIVNKEYRTQAQVYMWMSGIPRTIFMVKDKNNSQPRFWELSYNRSVIKRLMGKWTMIVRALKTKNPPDREYAPDSLQCKWCRHSHTCRG